MGLGNIVSETRIFAVFFISIVLVKAVINLYRLYCAKKLYDYYKDYLNSSLDKGHKGRKITSDHFNQKIPEIISIFKKAGLKNYDIPCERADNFGYVNHGSVSLFESLSYVGFVSETNFCLHVAQYFSQCVGLFKKRLKDAFNPIVWIETFVYLPKTIFTYFGWLEKTSPKILDVFLKILQLIYWCLGCYLLFIKVF